MQYSYSLNVLATHVVGSELKTNFDLPAGIIKEISVSFPGGCNRQIHVQIYKGATLLFPQGAGQDYCENQNVVKFPTYYEIDTNPTTFAVWCWGVGCSYPHKVILLVNHAYWDEPS